jgi:hypothetical protein
MSIGVARWPAPVSEAYVSKQSSAPVHLSLGRKLTNAGFGIAEARVV